MKIIVVGWGTTGDVYPLLALSERLSRKHDVRVCAPSIYEDKILEIGTDYYQVGTTFNLAEFHQTMDSLIKMRDPMAPLVIIAKEGVLRHGEKWYHDCLEAMDGYDLVICHSVDIPAQEAAIRLGIPWITVTYCPGYIKTPDNAPYPFPNVSRTLNRIIWSLVRLRLGKSIDPLFNQFIKSIGGTPRSTVASDEMYSPLLNLIAASTAISPSAELPSNHKTTGIWSLPEQDYTPPSNLVEFIEDGPTPIIISFGSMGGSDGAETTKILIDAIKITNQRAVIQAGWGQLGSQDTEKDIFFTDYVPHNWLFPKGSCVIHHGGAGTTAAVCKAKVPSIVVPHIADQFYWGKCLYKIGVAPKSLPRRNLSAQKLASRIQQVMNSSTMTEKAESLGTQMNSEDGLTNAVNLIEALPVSKQ
ncbi:glycosyltransferase family 1 protein [Candidatus Poribacteria bacterium]|nr:glycosyltransferase family 1 protein [Candidatus Poribacteria bacterium]